MKRTPHIFISYVHDEADFALTLASDLRNEGVCIWMDRLDGISVGMRWRDAIQQAINECEAMVCVLSPGYLVSDYCRKELGRADTLKRTIYPVLLRSIEAGHMPLELEGVQYEDFSSWPNEKGYARGLLSLLKRLRSETPGLTGTVSDAEQRYLTKLLATLESLRGVLQYVPLAGDAAGEELRPEPAEDEWGFSELVITAEPRLKQQPVPLQSITDAVAQYERFVLIGDAGAGKTTTLRKLARDAVLARQSHLKTAPLPLLLSLAEWKDEPTALDFVQSWYQLSTDLSFLLRDGKISLYLDGLNEMGADSLKKADLLGKWLQSPGAPRRVILTCRASESSVLNALSYLPKVVIKPLDNKRIVKFAEAYLGSQAECFSKLVLHGATQKPFTTPAKYRERKFRDQRGLIELARNTYMLSALVYLYEVEQRHGLPDKGAELFKRLVRALWIREEKRGSKHDLRFAEAEACYARLAYQVIAENAPLEIAKQKAVDTLGSPQMLYAGLGASYFTVSADHVRFTHQLLLEYFAAVALQDADLSTVVEPFDIRTGPNYLWLKYNYESRWYQPVLFVCELSKNPERRLQEIMHCNALLAAECVSEPSAISINLAQSIARRAFDEAHYLLIRLWEKQAWVKANRGNSGMWDDIEDSIIDSISELYEYSATTIARLGDTVLSVLREKSVTDKRLAVNCLERIGTAEAISCARHYDDENR